MLLKTKYTQLKELNFEIVLALVIFWFRSPEYVEIPFNNLFLSFDLNHNLQCWGIFL